MPTFIDLPFDVVNYLIAPKLDNKGLCSLSNTCSFGRDYTKEQRALRAQEVVLQAVVYGDAKKVIRLLKHNPRHLLSNIGKVKDYSGKVIEHLTPFQAALCAGDELVIEKMAEVFIKSKFAVKDKEGVEVERDGQEIMQEQFIAIYPNGHIDAVVQAQKLSADNCQLINNVFAAVARANDAEVNLALAKQFDVVSDLNSSLSQFRKEFSELSNKELIHNPYHLVKAYEQFVANYNDLGNMSKKSYLAWIQIVGYVQRCIPAYLAQDFVFGLFLIAKFGTARESVPPRLAVSRSKNHALFPLPPFVGPGYDYAIDATSNRLLCCCNRSASNHLQTLQEVFQIKTFHLQKFSIDYLPRTETSLPVRNRLR